MTSLILPLQPSIVAPPRQLFRRREAAAYLGLKPATLAADVCRSHLKIPMIRMGRVVAYDRDELDAWLNAHRVVG